MCPNFGSNLVSDMKPTFKAEKPRMDVAEQCKLQELVKACAEMKEKFREQFELIHSDVLRANYGMKNPGRIVVARVA